MILDVIACALYNLLDNARPMSPLVTVDFGLHDPEQVVLLGMSYTVRGAGRPNGDGAGEYGAYRALCWRRGYSDPDAHPARA